MLFIVAAGLELQRSPESMKDETDHDQQRLIGVETPRAETSRLDLGPKQVCRLLDALHERQIRDTKSIHKEEINTRYHHHHPDLTNPAAAARTSAAAAGPGPGTAAAAAAGHSDSRERMEAAAPGRLVANNYPRSCRTTGAAAAARSPADTSVSDSRPPTRWPAGAGPLFSDSPPTTRSTAAAARRTSVVAEAVR